MQSIVVIADKNEELPREYARKLVYLISRHPETKAAFYSIEEYERDEARLSGKNSLIIFGENRVSKDLSKCVTSWDVNYGVAWGINWPIAVLHMKDVESDADFEKLIRETKLISEEYVKRYRNLKKGAYLWGGFITLAFLPFAGPAAALVAGALNLASGLGTLIGLGGGRPQMRKMQYEYGIARFMVKHYENFIKQTP